MKQAPPHKLYMDNYLSHNTPDMQKDAATLGSFSNFPLSKFASIKCSLKCELFYIYVMEKILEISQFSFVMLLCWRFSFLIRLPCSFSRRLEL